MNKKNKLILIVSLISFGLPYIAHRIWPYEGIWAGLVIIVNPIATIPFLEIVKKSHYFFSYSNIQGLILHFILTYVFWFVLINVLSQVKNRLSKRGGV